MLNSQMQNRKHRPDSLDRFSYQPDYITYSDISGFIRRHFIILLAGVILGTLSAILYVWSATPLYTARAQLLIDPSSTQVLQDKRTEITLDAAHIQNQIEVIKSDKILIDVINKLDLLRDPEFGQMPQDGDEQAAEPNAYQKRRNAVDALQSRLDVRRSGVSHVIDIFVETREPQKSAEIANAIAKAYEQEQIEARATAARQSSEWLESRIHSLRAKLDEAARALQSFKSGREYAPSEGSGTTTAPTTVEALEATVEAYRKIYEGYYQAFTDKVEQQTYPVAGARIITPAAAPLHRSHPRSKLILALGVFIGSLAGLGVAFLRHVMDRTARTPKQIREYAGLDCLARIPRLPQSRPLLQRLGVIPRLAPTVKQRRAMFNYAADKPFSQYSGAIKALKTATSKTGGSERIHVLGVTSALPEEGKSTLAANLAGAFALTSGKTLLIDADLHSAAISKTLAPNANQGLLEVLNGTADAPNCIVSPQGHGPSILPAVLPDTNHAAYNLIGSEKMLALLTSLRPSYDMILIDMPPIMQVADAMTLSGLLDGVLLAVEWGRTPLDLVSDVSYGLHLADANILGVALTKVDEPPLHVRLRKTLNVLPVKRRRARTRGAVSG